MSALHRRFGVTASCLLFGLAGSAAAQPLVMVTSALDAGPGTLREAIQAANADRDATAIDFDIDTSAFGPGPWTIVLRSHLPEIMTPVLIRGFSQPGSVAASSPLDHGYRIAIDDSALTTANPQVGDHGAILAFARGSERSAVTGLVFAGNRSTGMRTAILILTDDIAVRANRFGVLPNGQVSRYDGVAIGAVCANRTSIGGSMPGDGNLIGGTERDAIMIAGDNHLIRHNWIGFDALGVSDATHPDIPNVINGSAILTGSIGVGLPRQLQAYCTPQQQALGWGLRSSTIADNRISATRKAGIALNGLGPVPPAAQLTRFNTIENNVFGQDLWMTDRSHVEVAVKLTGEAADNTIRHNLIRNATNAIVLGDSGAAPRHAGTGNLISGNRLVRVTTTAIGLDASLNFAPLPNDALDSDDGPNRRQNKPTLSAASPAGPIDGVLDSIPTRTYRIELFASRGCEPRCATSAQEFLGSFVVGTDSSGRASFSVPLGSLTGGSLPRGGLRDGDSLTATATDLFLSDTSELSEAVIVRELFQVTISAGLGAIDSPLAAMTGPLTIPVSVAGLPSPKPTGNITLVARTASGERQLGSGVLVNGTTTLLAPGSTGSFFPQAGRFEVFIRYAGDPRHAAAESAARTIVVFRPSIALRSATLSAPIRRDPASGDLERYDAMQNAFVPLLAGTTARLVDSERIASAQSSVVPLIDLALMEDATGRSMLDGSGGMLAASGGLIDAGQEVLDLLQADSDPRADALVRERATGAYAIVGGAFGVESGGEIRVPLTVGAELVFATSGDFNGDGFSDLVFRDGSSGAAIILFLREARAFTTLTIQRPGNQLPVAAADLDGDGVEELIWLASASGDVTATIIRPGAPVVGASARLPPGQWSTPGSGHFAVDRALPDFGRGHLVFADASSGEVVVWRNTKIVGNVLSAQLTTLYFDSRYVIERMR